ncbi:MAG: bacteriophage Gp15 family protein [Clostridiales Family XIII bacterium]|jgi:hypothetical protein|nr:bacteriophage Gp15 family protein [Clostridiales Family XIII bacterium]
MGLLTEQPPHTVGIGGREVPIDWGFRTSLRFAALMEQPSKTDAEIIAQGLAMYFPDCPHLVRSFPAEMADALLRFFRCGQEEARKRSGKRKTSGGIVSFEHDAPLIFAAFRGQYGIDLTQEEEMHWWIFRALFDGLREDELVVRAMGYRAMTDDDMAKMGNEQRAYYRRMRKEWALPKLRNPEDRELEERIATALMGGGDIDAALRGADG